MSTIGKTTSPTGEKEAPEIKLLIEQLCQPDPDLEAEGYPPTAPSRIKLWEPIYTVISKYDDYDFVLDYNVCDKVDPYALVVILRLLRAIYHMCNKCELEEFVKLLDKHGIYFVDIFWRFVTQ